MDISGKLVHKMAIFEGGLTPAQNQELAILAETVSIFHDKVWESWEAFVEAHQSKL